MNTISGYVFTDLSVNGLKDVSDTGINGVTIQLLDVNNNNVSQTFTNDQGYYEFTNVTVGNYIIKENQPSGYFDGLESISNTICTPNETLFDRMSINITSETGDYNSYNFAEIPHNGISGYVYVDINNNNIYDTGTDSAITNVQMKLINSAGSTVQTVTTDNNGYYIFDALAADTYTIRETQPFDYHDGRETINNVTISENNDQITAITVNNGNHLTSYNFIEVIPTPQTQAASIQGYVYKALIDDGTKDNNETIGITGVKISLKNSYNGSLIAQTFTDNEGKYIFQGLDPNVTYAITEIQPSNYSDGFDGYDSTGTVSFNGYVNAVNVTSAPSTRLRNDRFSGITVGAGQTAANFNFGEVEIPLMLNRARISGRIFLDINQNNDPTDLTGEGYLTGQKVILYQGSRQIAYANTNSQGFYLFNNLNPGTYQLRQSSSSSYLDGKDYLGTITGGTMLGSASIGGNDIFNVTLNSGNIATEFNFSERQALTAPPSPIYLP